MASAAPPDLKIPSSSSTVRVRIIDTTSHISKISTSIFVQPPIKGHDALDCPAFSFLIEHPSNRTLLFDLGVRKDIENFVPRISDRIKAGDWSVTVKQGVREQLEEHGVDAAGIEAIIWSHWHWDHTGDPSTFEKNTALIVGPGFKKAFVPGWPAKEDAPIRESDYEGRELREIEFSQNLMIGRFQAFDYFGDGSFYLLDSPGHAIGHLCGFARVSKDSFILMGGDACHHGGEFRPSQYLPLPPSISPNPLDRASSKPCPGATFYSLLPDGDHRIPFYKVARADDGSGASHDADEAEATIAKIIEADAHDKIFVVMAHDDTILDVSDIFPKYADHFAEKDWVEKGRWLFLKDFASAVKHE